MPTKFICKLNQIADMDSLRGRGLLLLGQCYEKMLICSCKPMIRQPFISLMYTLYNICNNYAK